MSSASFAALFVSAAFYGLANPAQFTQSASRNVESYLRALSDQGVRPASIQGVDRRNIPAVCGADLSQEDWKSDEPFAATSFSRVSTLSALPAGARMWEAVPGVIRNNGADTFRLEVDVNGPVNGVSLEVWQPIISQSGLTSINLRDDGLEGDRAANDRIFTSEPLRYNINWPAGFPPNFAYDTNSPAGVNTEDVGLIRITETNGVQSQFLIEPEVGLLSADVPLTEVIPLSPDVAVSGHVINVRGTNESAQKLLRGYGAGLGSLTTPVYAVLPDAFDFIGFFSTYHLERLPYNNGANFNTGVQTPVQVNYLGTGQGLLNLSGFYGSAGRLLGFFVLDTYSRGIYSANCAHEILHHWSCFISAFPIYDGAHYKSRSSAASLLGGHLWSTNGNGTWTLVCEEGRNGATHIAPIDKYMMGLLPSNAVPVLRMYPDTNPPPLFMCGSILSNVQHTLTISNIIAQYGPRTPGPGSAPTNFSIGFITESNGRFLNAVEMTFYEIFAAHIASTPPAEHADPYLGWNWAPLTRFFGTDTAWSTEVLSLLRPKILGTERLPDGTVRLSMKGLPGRSYVLESTTDFAGWMNVTNRNAAENGLFELVDSVATEHARFYRVRGQ